MLSFGNTIDHKLKQCLSDDFFEYQRFILPVTLGNPFPFYDNLKQCLSNLLCDCQHFIVSISFRNTFPYYDCLK